MNILDVQGSLVLGRQNKNWEDVSIPREAGIPVLSKQKTSFMHEPRKEDYLNMISFLLVNTAEYKVEYYEEQRHARGGPDADVEGGVVAEDPLLVVAGELVKAGAPDCGLVGEVPGAQLVAHLIIPGSGAVCDARSLCSDAR